MQKFERARVVGFDLDGTLIDTMADLTAALNLTLTALGRGALPESRVRALVGNGVEQFVVRALQESPGDDPMDPARQAAALELFRRLYKAHLFDLSKLYPQVEETLTALSAAGISLCCITNKHSEFALPLLEQARLAPYFEFTLCADRPEDRKPAANLLLAACTRCNVAPAGMLYVGDSVVDIQAARAAGCPVAAVSYGFNSLEVLEAARPDGVFAGLPALRAACLQAWTPGALQLCSTGAT